MSKLPKYIEEEIAKLNTLLPAQLIQIPEYVIISGRSTVRKRTGKVINSTAFVNHKRRMKNSYLHSPPVGHLLYFDMFLKPGKAKLQIWERIAFLTNKTLSPTFIQEVLGDEETADDLIELPSD